MTLGLTDVSPCVYDLPDSIVGSLFFRHATMACCAPRHAFVLNDMQSLHFDKRPKTCLDWYRHHGKRADTCTSRSTAPGVIASSGRLTCAAAASSGQPQSLRIQDPRVITPAQCFRHALSDSLPRRQTGARRTARDHSLISGYTGGPVRLHSPIARLLPAYPDEGLMRLTDHSAPGPGEQRFVILSSAQETILVRYFPIAHPLAVCQEARLQCRRS